MKPLIYKAVMAAPVGALMMGGMAAQAAATVLPPVHQCGTVEYLSGGIGLDESTAIKNVINQWPLTLDFAVKEKLRATLLRM